MASVDNAAEYNRNVENDVLLITLSFTLPALLEIRP
jgi:hypothetical protein